MLHEVIHEACSDNLVIFSFLVEKQAQLLDARLHSLFVSPAFEMIKLYISYNAAPV